MVEEERRAQAGVSGYISNNHSQHAGESSSWAEQPMHTSGESTQARVDADTNNRYVIAEAVEDDAYTIVDDYSDTPEEANGAAEERAGPTLFAAEKEEPEEGARYHERMHRAPTRGDPFPSPTFPGTMLAGEAYDADADDMVDTEFPWPSTPTTPPYSCIFGDDAPR